MPTSLAVASASATFRALGGVVGPGAAARAVKKVPFYHGSAAAEVAPEVVAVEMKLKSDVEVVLRTGRVSSAPVNESRKFSSNGSKLSPANLL